jgi:elongation factor Ts
MAEISAALVKQLRDRTSAGMMDCKKALQECGADMEKAVDWLRQKGLSKAAKRAGRATSEGVIASVVASDNRAAAMVEVKCETDFVTRSERFQAFAARVGRLVFDQKPETAKALVPLLGDESNDQIATIGENISVGRPAHMEASGEGIVSCYIHATGKIGVLAELACARPETAQKRAFFDLGRNVAMQVAASAPVALDAASLDPALVAREREVFRQKTLDEGKPAQIVEKIVDGRIQKFYKEVCLLEQPYIRDDSICINDLLASESKSLGDEVRVKRFVRLQLGEDNE